MSVGSAGLALGTQGSSLVGSKNGPHTVTGVHAFKGAAGILRVGLWCEVVAIMMTMVLISR